MTVGFAVSSSVYDCSNAIRYVRLRLHHSDFYEFSREVTRLRRLCEEDGALTDVRVERFLADAERYRYQVSAAPVAFNASALGAHAALDRMLRDSIAIQTGWPRFSQSLDTISSRLASLAESGDAPYVDCAACSGCKPDVAREAMVVGPTNLLTAAREAVDNLIGSGALSIITPSELRSGPTYDRLLLAGPLAWFARRHPHVLTAPRAPEIVSVSYDWLADSWRRATDFLQSETCPSALPKPPISRVCRLMPVEPQVEVLEEGVLPSSESLFGAAAVRGHGSTPHDSPPVPTRGFLLEPASMLLVEDDSENKMLAIDFTRESGKQVVKIPIGDIVPGVFVLHRSAGGGDFVVDLADRILGNRRDYLRGRQVLWKDKLRRLAMRDGCDTTARALQRCGSRIASYQNVRNWISTRNISTNDRADFDAIMRLVDLDRESDALWREMKDIRRAHLRAGQQIARLLIREVGKADCSELLALGYGDFDLGSEDGGVLTAQRVMEVVPGTPAYPEADLPMFKDI